MVLVLAIVVCALSMSVYASTLEDDLNRVFVGHTFTIRNFYRGDYLRYGSDGQLLEQGKAGYWSRDGMVEFSSVKVSKDDKLVLQGQRLCILLDQRQGEFDNVRTGDRLQIEVQLTSEQLNREAVLPLMQRVLLSSHDNLRDLIPSYWAYCVSRKVDRRDKNSPWECSGADKEAVPDFAGKKFTWDIPAPDTSVHNGMRKYLIQHRVAYLSEPGVKEPSVKVAPDPIFEWEQERTKVGDMTLVLAFTVGEDGRAHDVFIVSPVGMGIDDDAVSILRNWQFSPATLAGKPHPVHARVIFDIGSSEMRFRYIVP